MNFGLTLEVPISNILRESLPPIVRQHFLKSNPYPNMRIPLIIYLLIFLFSCNNAADYNTTETKDSLFIESDSTNGISELTGKLKHLIWLPIFDSASNDIELKQQRKVNSDTLNANKLIEEINASWDGIELVYRSISHDTIYVSIPASDVLTKQIGSSGAYSYIASTTYTLTELKNIHFVNYEFEEGDHLGPGTVKRKDFKK
jgi:hypothetical protein